MTQLADYQQEVLALLRDANSMFTTTANLTRYINLARREVAKRSACLQALITGQSAFGTSAQPGYAIPGAFIPGTLPASAANNSNQSGATATASNGFTTISGVELYTYAYANPFLQAQYSGYDKVIYVFNVSCNWGGSRPTLDWLPWNDMQAYCRAYSTGVNSYPRVWSQKGVGENGQVWLFPVPINSSFAEMEWECVCTPKPLYSNDDFEVIPEIYQGCVKYYAARMAFLGQQRMGQAQIMDGLFEEQLLISGVAGDWGHIDSHYPRII